MCKFKYQNMVLYILLLLNYCADLRGWLECQPGSKQFIEYQVKE